jgi:hypothetical protein
MHKPIRELRCLHGTDRLVHDIMTRAGEAKVHELQQTYQSVARELERFVIGSYDIFQYQGKLMLFQELIDKGHVGEGLHEEESGALYLSDQRVIKKILGIGDGLVILERLVRVLR